MAADLRVVALGWSQDHVERFFDGIEAGRQRLAELLHAIRTERLVCGHLAGELQGEDGGTRWCAGCEREARIRAEVLAEAAQVAERVARANSKLSQDMEDHDLLAAFDRHRAIAIAVREVEAQIRALAPGDYVAVRREDLEWLLEEAETCEVRMPTSNPTLNARYAERFQRIRAETEARVVEAVKRAIVGLRYDNPAQSAEECAWDDALWGAYRAIDAISPEDWIGVRAEDLAGLVDAARGAVSAAELIDRDRATDAGFLLALRMADALRDALARLP